MAFTLLDNDMTEEQRQLAMDIQNTFSTVPGKRTLEWIKMLSGYDEGINPAIVSPGQVMFFLGGREMFLAIDEKMQVDTTQPVQQEVAQSGAGVNKEGQQQEVADSDN